MKSGKQIMKDYISSRDHSGSKMDSYAQSLTTFYFQSRLQGEQEAFLALLVEAQNKFLVHVSPFDEGVPYDDYMVKDLRIADKL